MVEMGKEKEWPGVIWQVASWHSEAALGEVANSIYWPARRG